MIELSQVSKVYQKGGERLTALDRVNLVVEKGERVAVVGPSGSGKSTLLHILGGLDRPTSGLYRFEGRPVDGASGTMDRLRREKVAFVFQAFQLIPRMSALENVEVPLMFQGVPPKLRRKRAEEALARVHLEDRMHHTPDELSGGQQQRVAIARAIARDAELLLADEPTGNLDGAGAEQVFSLFEELQHKGKTVLLITHDRATAERFPRMLVMDGGHLTEAE